MLELLVEWGAALEKGGPWFLVAILGASLVFVIRYALKRIDTFRTELRKVYEKKDAEKDEFEEKLRAQEDKYREAMQAQSREHTETIESIVGAAREKEARDNERLIEITTTLTRAMSEASAAQSLLTNALDKLTDKVDQLRGNS